MGCKQNRRIILAGMKHCGKSTHGRALAAHWRCPFYDTDELVVAAHLAQTGESLAIREFCVRVGEEAFAQAEVGALIELYGDLKNSPGPYVIALGGRLVTNPETYPILAALGALVFLRVEPETLFQRVMAGGRPPFLSETTPHKDFLRIYGEREPYYTCVADLTIPLDDLSVQAAQDRIIPAVEEFSHAG